MTSETAPSQHLSLERWDVSGSYRHPHWLAHVCTALAERGVSVVDGHAVRRSNEAWEGHLVVDARGTDGELPDLGELAVAAPRSADAAAPVLQGATVLRRVDGLLRVDVTADDELGFLGRFLRRVSVLTLLPVEVSIATRDGVVSDRLVLAGIGGRPPSDDVEVALARALSGLLEG